ncbi:MAG TPA: M56 family metallopeptidase [Bryobacteraceae bacterium]|nr:M56 family metallopeptidase [Bryobacteraceae bacterium]
MRLEKLLLQPATQALGHALLHFLWQGSLLALLLWVIKTLAPASPRVRYAAASLIMLMMPLTLVVTVAHGFRHERPVVSTAPIDFFHVDVRAEASRKALLAALPTSRPSAGIAEWFPGFVVCLWIGGVFLLSLRATGGWRRARNLKRRGLCAGEKLEDMMSRLKRRVSISAPVRLYTSAIARVPMVIGWIQPCILVPVTAISSLSESQLGAILAHELAHIRRHDYLINLLQTAIETVLFYHPAVWWAGTQMRIEREHCCDDIAVAVSGNAIEYAGALVELEEIRARIPEPAIAATGGELLGRIRRLLGQKPSEDPASRFLGSIAAGALLLFLIAGPAVIAQQPAFDVASIKRNLSGGPERFKMFPAFSVENATLKDLILMAYEIQDFRISGGPGWIASDRYDIEAKAEGTPAFNQEVRLLQERRLQMLLQSRFRLVLHRETKELPIYVLSVAKGGLKLYPLKEGDCIARDPSKLGAPLAPGKTPMDYCGYGGFARGLYENSTASIGDVAGALSTLLGRKVVDKTGVTGRYRIHLTFAPDDSMPRFPDSQGGPGTPAPPADAGPNIFTAVQEQLGLKLESGKGPIEVLVIDHAEKPSDN